MQLFFITDDCLMMQNWSFQWNSKRLPFKIPICIYNLNMCQFFSFHGDCTIRDGKGLQESSFQSATEMSISENTHILLSFFLIYLPLSSIFTILYLSPITRGQQAQSCRVDLCFQHTGFPPRVPTQGRFQAQMHNHGYISHTNSKHTHTHMLTDCKAPRSSFSELFRLRWWLAL